MRSQLTIRGQVLADPPTDNGFYLYSDDGVTFDCLCVVTGERVTWLYTDGMALDASIPLSELLAKGAVIVPARITAESL